MTVPPCLVRVMGTPGVTDAEGNPVSVPAGKPLALLYYLTRHPDGVLRDELADLLWPGSERTRALHSLRQALWRIRKELTEACIESDDPVRLAPGRVESDVDRMLRALDDGALHEALAWWETPPLSRLRIRDAPAWERWADREREGLERRLLTALEEAARSATQRGDPEEALRWADEALARAPWRVAAHELRIAAQIQLRDAPAAREALARARHELREPEAVDHLEEAIRRLGVPEPEEDDDEATLRTPFVGRRSAWGELLTAWGRARDKGARIALITGDEGSGRSRLASEVARNAADDGARRVEISLVRTQRSLRYSAIRDLSRKLFPLSGAAGISHASDRILQSLIPSRAVGASGDEGEITIPDGVLVADAVMDLIGAVAEDGPLVLWIDGVQWLDPASAEVLAPVLRDLGSLPILVLLTPSGRDPLDDHPFPFLEREARFLRIHLDPLSRKEVRGLLEHLLEATTPADALHTLSRRLHQASGGVPGPIVELLHHLRGTGALLPRPEGRWKLEPGRIPRAGDLRAHLARGAPPARRRAGGLVAALVLLLLVAAGAYLAMAQTDEASAWGGGTLVAVTTDEALLLTPGPGPFRSWEQSRRAPDLPLGESRLEFLLPDGRFAVQEQGPEEKPWISLRRPDGIDTLFWSEGDNFIRGLRLDGNEALVVVQPTDVETYRLDLWQVPIGEGEPRLLLETEEWVRAPVHSPDGRRMAMVSLGPVDSFFVLSAGGERLLGIPWEGGLESLTWCPGEGGLVGIRSTPEAARLVRIDPLSGESEPLDALGFPGRDLVCSPDGRALVYSSAVEGRIQWVLHELDTGVTDRIDPPASPIRRLHWLPPEAPPIPETLVLATEADDPLGPELRLEWGRSVVTIPRVRWSDEELRDPDGALQWVSDDPSVADVTAGGTIHGNRPGTTTLRAVWDGWLERSLEVVVEGAAPEGAIFQDPLSSLDPALWLQVGYPPSRIVEREGESVLLLDGDALYRDGVITRDPVTMPRGGTVELEFRMALTRPDKQWFHLCLVEGELPPEPDEGFELVEIQVAQMPCVRVPNGQFSRLDREAFRIVPEPGFADLTFRAPDHLPPDDWTQIALQLRPDGTLEVLLNRTPMATSPIRVEPDTSWRILLIGSSYETEVLARNVSIWDGPRY